MLIPHTEKRLSHALRQTEAIGEVVMKVRGQPIGLSVRILSTVADLLVCDWSDLCY
jgi:hypothetical protein